jgi:methionyl-tRNA synthetase
MNRKFYITAAIPYVNAKPHIGHVLEFIQVDVLKRYHQLLGEDAVSLSGGDENALKNVQAAQKAGRPLREFIDENTEAFRQVAIKLNAEFTYWQKGSDQKVHFPSSQDLWRRCEKDIYKKLYQGLYCVDCETFYSPEELDENGQCYEHPGKKLDEVQEENYFFRLSAYQEKLIRLIETGELKIVPEFRRNEVLSFLKSGLEDISISRSNERARNWGVPVPGDPNQRIYVWFDALNIYRSGVPEKYWPADVHAIGKGISRFHCVYWPAFLLSAGLPLPKTVFIHGYLTVNGQKISKSNPASVIDPIPLIDKYGADALRYFLLAKISPFDDSDFSEKKLIEVYNADLANGLGNLVARIAKLAQKTRPQAPTTDSKLSPEVKGHLDNFRFDLTLEFLWQKIKRLNSQIDENQPWKLDPENLEIFLSGVIPEIQSLAFNLQPFIPQTAQQILKQFSGQITASPPLFPRVK